MLSFFIPILLFCAVIAKDTNVMIISTTDVHGYVYGHTDKPGEYIDYGDFRRFTECMENNNEDYTFLRLDSGDLIQGTGLSDFTDIPGEYIYQVFHMFGYDATTIGNHDAGEPSSMEYIVKNDYTDMFVSGNVFYQDGGFGSKDNCTYEGSNLISNPYRIIERDGLVFLILGFLYGENWEDNTCNLKLNGFFTSKYWDEVQEKLKDKTKSGEPDFVITLNHISSNDNQQKDIYKNIREVYPNSMMVMLNGHSHREEEGTCGKNSVLSSIAANDKKCVYMESGCYMYSFGVITLNIGEDGSLNKYDLSHYEARYNDLEQKCQGFTSIESEVATQIDEFIDEKIKYLGILDVIGISNWFYDKDLIQTKENALWRLYYDAAVPVELYSKMDKNINKLPDGEWTLFINAGSLRKDLLEGPILKENVSNILPFKNVFVYLTTPLKGSQLKKVYEDINYKEDLYDDDIDYYLIPLVYTQIEDDTVYTIISSNYDCVKVENGIHYGLPDEEIDVEWVEIEGVPDMMSVLELYLEEYFHPGIVDSSTIQRDYPDLNNFKNENVVYITLMIIFSIATVVAQIVARNSVKGKM